MRRLVVAVTVLALSAVLAGCGGGDTSGTTSETEDTSGQTAAAAPVVPAGTALIADRSARDDATVFEPFPLDSTVPKALAEKIKAKQPTLILFMNSSQKVTSEVRQAVDAAIEQNSGVVELVVFDIGKYTSVDASGNAVVDAAGISDDKTGSQAVILAHDLGVTTLPYIVMTDDQGYVVFRHRGLVDEEFLEMHMERLTD